MSRLGGDAAAGAAGLYVTGTAGNPIAGAPTGGFPDAFADRLPTDRESAAGRPNFAVLEAALYRLEWLGKYLHADGHRRAAFTWPGGRLKATWLVP